MAWTAGVTRTTGDLITAAQWNSYLGAAGSLDYLKTEADKHDDVSQSEPARSINTVYQNTSGKLRLIAVHVEVDGNYTAYILSGSGASPTNKVAKCGSDTGQIMYWTLYAIIPVNWYYELDGNASYVNIDDWIEWDLL